MPQVRQEHRALQAPLAQLVIKRNRYSKTYFLVNKKLLLITCSRCCSTGSSTGAIGPPGPTGPAGAAGAAGAGGAAGGAGISNT